MKCPECGGSTKVTDSRKTYYGVRRTHECLICSHKFGSAEITKDEYNKLLETHRKYNEIVSLITSLGHRVELESSRNDGRKNRKRKGGDSVHYA